MAGGEGKKDRAADDGKTEEKTFEALVRRLEEIVEALEAGEIPLEKSLALFEEGVGLARQGHRRLEEAERRITVLMEDGSEKAIAAGAGSEDGGDGGGNDAADDGDDRGSS